MNESEQKAELDQLLYARTESERRNKKAAQTIEAYLQSHKAKLDLGELAGQIRAAII
jgi:hypothetical protein